MITHQPRLIGQVNVPGDKSITHRALIFAALCNGQSEVVGPSPAKDCESTAFCLQALGLHISECQNTSGQTEIRVGSTGLEGLSSPANPLNVGNSGTTIRLLTGLLSGRALSVILDGDDSIRSRPMDRIFQPLQRMGAKFSCLLKEDRAPFEVVGGSLRGIAYTSKVASAQVQTAFLLAALQANVGGSISLPGVVRDHTVNLFRHMNIPIEVNGTTVNIENITQPLDPFRIEIPGDISSAAYFMVAAALVPGSDLLLPGVGLNPGRRLIIDVLKSMGAEVTINNVRSVANEVIADIRVRYKGRLHATSISGRQISIGIDEIPVISLLGCLCEGNFSVKDAAELRYKESDRLTGIIINLRDAGVEIEDYQDGFTIKGSKHLIGGSFWHSHGDHRLAMTGLVANLLCDTPIHIDNTDCVGVSYPSFKSDLEEVLC